MVIVSISKTKLNHQTIIIIFLVTSLIKILKIAKIVFLLANLSQPLMVAGSGIEPLTSGL